MNVGAVAFAAGFLTWVLLGLVVLLRFPSDGQAVDARFGLFFALIAAMTVAALVMLVSGEWA